MENHSVLHNSASLLGSLTNRYGAKKVNLLFSIDNLSIPKEIQENFGENIYNEKFA